VIQAVQNMGKLNNTLIIYISGDNAGSYVVARQMDARRHCGERNHHRLTHGVGEDVTLTPLWSCPKVVAIYVDYVCSK
jgi:hypothetical protein